MLVTVRPGGDEPLEDGGLPLPLAGGRQPGPADEVAQLAGLGIADGVAEHPRASRRQRDPERAHRGRRRRGERAGQRRGLAEPPPQERRVPRTLREVGVAEPVDEHHADPRRRGQPEQLLRGGRRRRRRRRRGHPPRRGARGRGTGTPSRAPPGPPPPGRHAPPRTRWSARSASRGRSSGARARRRQLPRERGGGADGVHALRPPSSRARRRRRAPASRCSPWSASQLGSPQVAGSRSTRDTAPQPMTSVSSCAGCPGTCFSGSGTTWVRATEVSSASGTASVVADADADGCSESAGWSSTWATTSRVGVSTSTVTWRRTSAASNVVSGWTRWATTSSSARATSSTSTTSSG